MKKIQLYINTHFKIFSAFAIALLCGLLSLGSIYALGEYGIFLFLCLPFFMGLGSSLLYSYKRELTWFHAWTIGFLTLGIYTIGLIAFAIEGMICIIMAAPIGILTTFLGSAIGYLSLRKAPKKAPSAILVFFFISPLIAWVDKINAPPLLSVVTGIEIEASPSVVWKNVIEFPELKEPSELLFKSGIAYPINARIEGNGVGAVRHCNFTTGSFVEPITIWDENKLLAFDVIEQPEPMKEISFWDINAPHLHDYFVSKKGQFKLMELPNGNTYLEGTTWYYHNIKPQMYWSIWSEYIIHKIHNRVLQHIKSNAEQMAQNPE